MAFTVCVLPFSDTEHMSQLSQSNSDSEVGAQLSGPRCFHISHCLLTQLTFFLHVELLYVCALPSDVTLHVLVTSYSTFPGSAEHTET